MGSLSRQAGHEQVPFPTVFNGAKSLVEGLFRFKAAALPRFRERGGLKTPQSQRVPRPVDRWAVVDGSERAGIGVRTSASARADSSASCRIAITETL
jgi:hypothetical protein